jgi:cyclomaltodextrinase
MTNFSESAILWQVFPLGALGAPDTNPEVDGRDHTPVRTLADLIPWLDHAIRVGANVLSLGPIFHSYSHGYDTIDFYRIDPRLGTMNDFKALADAAHERGMKIILDGVFNHVGSRHEMVQSLREGPDSQYAECLLPNWDGWQEGELPDYHCFEGHTGLATLNHQNSIVRRKIAEVMNYWLEQGADGWRLDAAYSMDPHVWQDILPEVRGQHPDVWIVAEVIHGDYPQLVEDSGWDSLTQYELWKATWSALNDQNFFELDWTLQRHNEFLDQFLPQTFIGNHDVTRIASKLETEDDVGLAVAVLMTTGGIPSIYYGDEIGFTGVKEERLGGDDAIRQPLPDSPQGQLDSSRAGRFFHWYSSLSSLRRQHPWLWHARTKIVELENEVMRYVSFNPNGHEAITVVMNLSDKELPHDHRVFAGAAEVIAGQFDTGALRPHAYIIFEGACGSDLRS